MTYVDDLNRSAAWLVDSQNPDGGWGLTPRQESSLVNTAEALFVLRRSGMHGPAVVRGREFLRTQVFPHIEKRGPRIRYVAFTLLALAEGRRDDSAIVIGQCSKWLLAARSADHGWPSEKGNQESDLLSTYLALHSLLNGGCDVEMLELSLNWLLSRANANGWSLEPNGPPSALACAYAVRILSRTHYRSHDLVRVASTVLYQNRDWGSVDEAIPGTVWKHTAFPIVVPALIDLGAEPYSPTIADGVRFINTLRSSEGGWNESAGPGARSIRGQYWAVMALDAVANAFDPGIHSIRIDAERAQPNLAEPAFVKLKVHSRWATILPSPIYRGLAYGLVAGSVAILFGVFRLLPASPPALDPVIAAVLLLSAYQLARYRPKQFPRLYPHARLIAVAFAVIGLLLGAGIATVLQWIKQGVAIASEAIGRAGR
jgi:hypothetical protein